jgi:inhibitor of KinA sporulation pathway (predicted exonuclease)
MKFFIDFEATQFSNEIISVGVVAEDGDSFYSTVRSKNCKVTPFIEKLTGLTRKEIMSAPTADEVFDNLWYWIMEKAHMSNAKFYVYGGQDAEFIRHTIPNCENYFANMCLCRILGNLNDYTKIVEKKLKIVRSIGLTKILQAFKGEDINQKHNALDDAFYLQELFEYIESNAKFKEPIEEKYYTEPQSQQKKAIDGKNHYFAFGQEFNSMKEAATYVYHKMHPKTQKQTNPNQIAKKINRAISRNEKYFGEEWRREKCPSENGLNNAE